jgi:HSP20 family molecular chaperone IbpA
MAVEEKVEQKVTEVKEPVYRYHVSPRYNAWTEGDKVILHVALPGVHKEKVKMKALRDYFTLEAARDDVKYELELNLGVDIVPGKTKTTYDEGLLKVEFERYNPLDDAYEVPIN